MTISSSSGVAAGKTGRSTEKGGALLAVLWMSAALAAIAFSVSTTVRGEIDRVAADTDGLRAHYLASGSVERAIQWMLWGWQHDYRNQDGSPTFWAPDQPRLYFRFASGDAVVEMIPESARLNINTAQPDVLTRVIQSVGGPQVPAQEIASAIVEWRTGANSLDSFYLSLGPSFRPPHASFQEIEELLSVRGVTPELFYGNFVTDDQGRLYARGGLRDCFSVRGTSVGPFDADSTSPALMEAMGVAAGDAERIVEMRKVRAFMSLGDLRSAGIGAGQLSVGGNVVWTLRATARLRRPDGSPSAVVRSSAALVKLLNKDQYYQMPLHVLRYYDDAWSQFSIAPPAAAFGGLPLQGAR
jgi:general secretion pathway protein K